eukprot:13743486-Alexandrium_andersonii.AAC.1
MACVMFPRLGACSARGRGGGGTSWATRGMTCGATPEDTGSRRHIHGAATSSRRASRDQRSPKGRRATARTSRTSRGPTATM